MARLLGKIAGDVVVEFLGVHQGRNYFATSHAPSIEVQLFGNGSVQAQNNPDFIFQGERNSGYSQQLPINMTKVAKPTSWVNLGAAITSASGIVTLVPPVETEISFIRFIVVTPGDGYFTIATHWD